MTTVVVDNPSPGIGTGGYDRIAALADTLKRRKAEFDADAKRMRGLLDRTQDRMDTRRQLEAELAGLDRDVRVRLVQLQRGPDARQDALAYSRAAHRMSLNLRGKAMMERQLERTLQAEDHQRMFGEAVLPRTTIVDSDDD